MKLGGSRGSHWVWEGTPSPAQSDAGQLVTSVYGRHVRLERRVMLLPYVDFTERGRDECPSSEGRTQPLLMVSTFHRVLRGWWSPQNHHTDHRERAAHAATAEPTSGFELDLRYL